MAFDAGSVEAKLTLDPSAFDRDMAKAETRVKKFQDEPHRVKISAVFDDGDLSRARKLFSDLDTAISKDAMNRLRSSPQGSVLGSLNALFSPHPVTGAPSPQQSAQQGLLGKMLNVPGDNSSSGSSGGSSAGGQSGGGNGTSVASILENAPGNTSTTDDIRQQLEGQGPGNVDTTDKIAQQLTGTGPGNVTTTDDIKQNLEGNAPGNVTTTDTIKQNVTGAGAKDTTTTDTVKEKLDPASEAKTESDSGASGGRAGTSWASMFASHLKNLLPKSATDATETASASSGDRSGTRFTLGFGGHLGPFFAGLTKSFGDAGDSGGASMGAGLLDGIGPGILGIGLKMSSVVGLVGSALGTLPALAGIIGTGMGVALIGGLLAAAVSGNAKLKAQFSALGGDFTSVITAAAAPVIPALSAVLGQVPALIAKLQAPLTGIFSAIAPQIQGVFNGITPVITGLLGVMKDAAPAFGPFIGALESLISNIFPGIQTVVKATVPFITQFAGDLSSLGSGLGGFFADASPAIGASMKILTGLLGVVSNLLPAVIKVAGIFATSLGPVFTDFTGVVNTLIKPLTLIGQVVAQFAGAVIGDLAGAFGAIASLITGLAPSLNTLSKTLSNVFITLENTGVFAVFGDALENLAVPIANLVNALVNGLAPALPALTGAFSDLINIFVGALSSALGVVLQAVTPVVSILATGAADVITFMQNTGLLVPVLAGLVIAFGPVAGAITAMAAGLTSFATGSFVLAVAGIVTGIQDFIIATEGATLAEKALLAAEIAFDAFNPFGWVALGVIALGGLVIAANDATHAQTNMIAQLEQQNDAVGYNIAGYQNAAKAVEAYGAVQQKVASQPGASIRGDGGVQSIATAAQQAATQLSQTAVNMQTRLTALSGSFGVSETQIEQWASAAGISAAKFGGSGEDVNTLTNAIVGYVNKNPQAVLAASNIGTQIAIFGDDAFNATTQLDAFNAIWNTLVGNLLSKQEAVTNSDSDFDGLAQTIKTSGANSDAAKQSFQQYISQIGSSASTLLQNGASINTINGYLQGQISNIKSLGPLNASEKADLQALTSFQTALANSTKGLNAQQVTLIGQFEDHLIPDLVSMHADTPKVKTDIDNLTNSIIQTGAQSASTAGDRAQLIKDLENAGDSASTAKGFVDKLQTSINGLKGKVVNVGVTASAQGTLTAVGTTLANQKIQSELSFGGTLAAGGLIGGTGGPKADDKIILASTGEYIMNADAVKKYGTGMMDLLNAEKFASGGLVNMGDPENFTMSASMPWTQDDIDTFMFAAVTGFTAANKAALAAAAAALNAQSLLHPTGSGATIQAMMQSMAASVGWTGAEWTALNAVEQREANYSLTATNPSSGAYGLAQFIDGASEYAQYGGNATTATGQITAMLSYIKSRYGDPIAAEAHEQAYGWYGNGGIISEPVLGYGVNSGRGYVIGENGSEMVTPLGGKSGGGGASSAALLAKLDQLITVTRQIPAGVGDQVGGAIGGSAQAASFRSRYPRGGS